MKIFFFIFYCLVVSKTAHANIHSSDIQSFNPAADNGEFVTVQSNRILPEGTLNFGGFFDYATNTLPAALDAAYNKYGARNTISSLDLHAALGILPRWQVGLSLGSTLDTQVKPDYLRDYYKVNGLTDLRLSTKVKFYQNEQWELGLHFLIELPQVENDYLYGKSNLPSYAAEILGSIDFNQWSFAANFGYNLRQNGDKIIGGPYDPVGDLWLASTAGAYRFADTPWTAVAELFATVAKQGTQNYSQNELSALEGLAGAKYKWKTNLDYQAGLTSGLSKGLSSPDSRIYVGLNWQVSGLWDNRIEQNKPVVKAPLQPTVAPLSPQVEFPPMSNFIVSNMNFESGSAVVSDSYNGHLKEFVEFVNAKKSFKQVRILGYTDNVGKKKSNLKLSENRARAVADILVSFGLDKSKVSAQGMGDSNPISSNKTKEGRQTNRRIEFTVEE